MQAHLHRVEVELALTVDHDLAVERGVRWQEVSERTQLREITEERSSVAAPERQLTPIVLEDSAESVPLRLVLPALARRQRLDEEGLHRREGDVRSRHQRASPAARSPLLTSSSSSARIAFTRLSGRKSRSVG